MNLFTPTHRPIGFGLLLSLAISCGMQPAPQGSAVQSITTETTRPTLANAVDREADFSVTAFDPSDSTPATTRCLPPSQRPNTIKPASLTASRSASLSAVFAKNCSGCHGDQGKGKGTFPDITKVSYKNLVYSVRNGRAGIMPAFAEQAYSQKQLDADFTALTGQDIPQDDAELCPIDKSGDNDQIAPSIAYRQLENGPKARGLGFALDPFVLPYVMCKEFHRHDGSGLTEKVCANVGISGSTEEGRHYADFGVCRDIRTQRPYRPIAVKNRNGRYDAEARLQDPKFATELAWITEQVRASGCVCCHDSTVDRRTAFWDISKDKIWTDQLDKYAVEVFTGRVDSTALGAYKPQDNFGFDRYHTGLPTTDVPRMQAFFKGLAQDLGTSEQEIKTMPPLADFLASQLRNQPPRCEQGIGVDEQTQKIRWKLGPVPLLARVIPARFVFVLTEDAQTPLVTPNLDKPKGTLWRLDASSFYQGFRSDTIRYGEVPGNGTQTIPDPARFAAVEPLVKGKNYRLVVQLDVAFPLTNCMFTYGE